MVTPAVKTNTVVMDNGTGLMKVGRAGEETPRSVFKTVVASPKTRGIVIELDRKDVSVGDEAIVNKGVLNLAYPIERGLIKMWEDMDKVWNYAFSQVMNTTPEAQPLLLTEPPLNPREIREKVTEVMFESFGVPSFYLGIQAVLALYASGRSTGLVLDSGEGVTNVVPVYEGFAVPQISRLPLGGSDLSAYFWSLLKQVPYDAAASRELSTVDWLKEKVCQVALDYETTMKNVMVSRTLETEETLPDGNRVVVSTERIKVPEILFQPKLAGHDFEGIHRHIHASIQKCGTDLCKNLYKTILLAGGSTLFPQLGERLKKEVKLLVPPSTDVAVYAPGERKCTVWKGGSIIAAMCSFSCMYITRNEYNEIGREIVHRKCF